ncbi:MAG: T9SS C-terminal target domain-containing protein [Myxococcales bacterium]|nr:T9SS C-terminal target domain-containing protein [Myxococcales bacterium]
MGNWQIWWWMVGLSVACGGGKSGPTATLPGAVDATVDTSVGALDALDVTLHAVDASADASASAVGQPGLRRESFGVWDRSGYQTVAKYPFTRGQEYSAVWSTVNPAQGSFDWTALDAQLAFADTQNEHMNVQISPIGGAKGSTVPAWIFATGVPKATDGTFTYGHYLNPGYKAAFSDMVQALAKHLRQGVAPALRARIAFVRCDTGATGDEAPYEEPDLLVPKELQISNKDWQSFRLWAFETYRHAFQDGPGPMIPLLFQDIENTGYPVEWEWVRSHVLGGFGAKYGGQVRGHHLSESQAVPQAFKAVALDPAMHFFSRNEMDQTWSKPFFQLNIRLNMYWAAVEQLHAGMSIWDITQSCLERTAVDGLQSDFEFFNKWAGQVDATTAGGGFCILHEGLDASDIVKFPVAAYGNLPANKGSKQRYVAICKAYAGQGAQMDDVDSATKGQVAQRDNQNGFNDAGWKIVPGNYERFITQLQPDTTSKGLWRINGPLTSASHRYDRFARRFDHAAGMDTLRFDVQDQLLASPGQRLQLTVDYLDRGTGQFALQYDALGDNHKTAFTVTKSNSNTWKTKTVEVTDWVCGNHGPNGADLMLVNLDADDDIFHGIEVVKLADVTVGVVGKGAATARSNATTYAPVVGTFMEGQRLELAVAPEPGWVFTGWSGDLSGINPRLFLFPTRTTQVTAHFALAGP